MLSLSFEPSVARPDSGPVFFVLLLLLLIMNVRLTYPWVWFCVVLSSVPTERFRIGETSTALRPAPNAAGSPYFFHSRQLLTVTVHSCSLVIPIAAFPITLPAIDFRQLPLGP